MQENVSKRKEKRYTIPINIRRIHSIHTSEVFGKPSLCLMSYRQSTRTMHIPMPSMLQLLYNMDGSMTITDFLIWRQTVFHFFLPRFHRKHIASHIQIRRKYQPKNIWNHKHPRPGANHEKPGCTDEDQRQHTHQPHKSKQVHAHIKKYNRPIEVHRQLYHVDDQGHSPMLRFRDNHKIRSQAHHQIQNRPRY